MLPISLQAATDQLGCIFQESKHFEIACNTMHDIGQKVDAVIQVHHSYSMASI